MSKKSRFRRFAGAAATVAGGAGLSLFLAAETWQGRLAVALLTLLSCVVFLGLGLFEFNQRGRAVGIVVAIALMIPAVGIALNPQLFVSTGFCNTADEELGLYRCVRVQTGQSDGWTESTTASPGSVVLVKGVVKSTVEQINDTVVNIENADFYSDISGTAMFSNSKTGFTWLPIEYSLLGTGINAGSYAKGGAFFITFALKIAPPEKFSCGKTTVPLPMTVTFTPHSSEQRTVRNEATLTVVRKCT